MEDKTINQEEAKFEAEVQIEKTKKFEEEEEFPEYFGCSICKDLLYKPVVFGCGHILCFWCAYNAMNFWHQSKCPLCSYYYNRFPRICELLHFLLSKLYPVNYKIRESEVGEKEKKDGCFSPQFDCSAFDSHSTKESNSSKEATDKKFLKKQKFKKIGHGPQDGTYKKRQKGMKIGNGLEDGTHKKRQKGKKIGHGLDHGIRKTFSSSNFLFPISKKLLFRPVFPNINLLVYGHGTRNKLYPSEFLCFVCEKLLFRPVFLVCGHAFCQSCIIPVDGNYRCQVCQSHHPSGLPKICLAFEHFLEEQFPKSYGRKRETSLEHPNSPPSRKFGYLSCEEDDTKVHFGVGCDSCGMSPILGERYKCKECVEKIGFDLCEACYNNNTPSKTLGRFNQQHKPEHKFEIVQPVNEDWAHILNITADAAIDENASRDPASSSTEV